MSKSPVVYIWNKIFDIEDHTEGAERLIHNDDGSVTNAAGAYEYISFIFDACTNLTEKIDQEEFRTAHNMERLENDAKIIRANYESVQSPQLTALILFYRFCVYHPKRTQTDNFTLSKSYAIEQLESIYQQIQQLRQNDQFKTSFPSLQFTWFDDEFIAKFSKLFDIVNTNTIPSEYGSKYDEDCSVEYNTSAWVLDIIHHIYGQDQSTHDQWEVAVRSEYAFMPLDDYKTKRQPEQTQIVKYKFFIPIMNKDYGKYVKDNVEMFDFDMNEPYEEDLEELVSKLPSL